MPEPPNEKEGAKKNPYAGVFVCVCVCVCVCVSPFFFTVLFVLRQGRYSQAQLQRGVLFFFFAPPVFSFFCFESRQV